MPGLPPRRWVDPLGLTTRVPDVVDDWLGSLRTSVSDTLTARVAGADAAAHRDAILQAPGPRWFDDDSPVRVVHADLAMLVGGLLAVFRQSMHPRAMAGVAQHSRFREDPWGRLHRTGRFLGAVTFGSRETADRAVAAVRQIHERVTGVDRRGRPYAANEPRLLLWVHCAELESFVAAHRAYGALPLTPAEYDRYVEEMARVAEALGSAPAPRSRAELADVLRGFAPELAATPEARRAARYLVAPPGLTLPERAGYAPVLVAAIALLPVQARIGLRLPVTPVSDRLLVPPIASRALRLARWAAT